MSGFTFGYCTELPSASVEIAFYGDYVAGSPPQGNEVLRVDLTGLPGYNGNTDSCGGNITCYTIDVDFLTLLAFPEGAFAYSWKFTDHDLSGSGQAGTWPILAYPDTQSIGATALGIDGYSFGNLNWDIHFPLVSGRDHSSMYLEIHEAKPVSFTAHVENGLNVNPDTVTPIPVRISQLWDCPLQVNPPRGAGGLASLNVSCTYPVFGPVLNNLPGGIPYQRLTGPRCFSFTRPIHFGQANVAGTAIPKAIEFLGLNWTAQWVSIGGGIVTLSEAATGYSGT